MTEQQATLFRPGADEVDRGIIEQIRSPDVEPTAAEVESAISIMQHHLDKEARNRQVTLLSPDDLCPSQKRDMVRDLVRLLRA